MKPEFIAAEDLNREDWLRWRRRGIGGSDTAALLGHNSWRGPYAIYHEKVDLSDPTDELDMSKPGHEQAYWGRVLEDIVCKEFGIRTGYQVHELKVVTQNPRYPWLFATVDRFVWESPTAIPLGDDNQPVKLSAKELLKWLGPPDAVLECKTTTAFHEDDWMGGIPIRAYAQIQHYLTVTELPHAWACALIGGQKFVHSWIERDQQFIDQILEVTKEFWDRVERRDPPPADGKSSTSEIIDAMAPLARSASTTELPATALSQVGELIRLKSEAKQVAEDLGAIQNRLKLLLGEHEVGTFDGAQVVTWRAEHRRSVDRKLLEAWCEANGIAVDQFMKVSDSRVLRVRYKGEEE